METPLRPPERTVLLVGASSGIGRALAIELAREGHRLALVARGRERLEHLRDSLAGGWDRHLALACDLSDARAAGELVPSAEAALGPLDTLIYSAGAARFDPVVETSDESWDLMLRANLTGLFHAVRAVLPGFQARGRGQLVAILSIASRHAFAGSSAYTASKFGALGFIESVRAEVRAYGIHVTAVLPGATDTPLWDALGSSWDRTKMMPPEEVARVVASALRTGPGAMLEEIRILPGAGALCPGRITCAGGRQARPAGRPQTRIR